MATDQHSELEPGDEPASLDQAKLARLLEVSAALVSELDLESVLTDVIEAARELTGARYAALGVLDTGKEGLERFLFSGIDEHTRAEIGPLPSGRGVLGELIRDPRPLRLARISDHPRSYGFPAGHPPMTTFLGVPVTIRGEVFGNLYLTEKAGGAGFDEQDERLLGVLAEYAAIAIDNARIHESAERRGDELERAVRGLQATASLSRELGGETDMERVRELISKRGRDLMDAASFVLLVPAGDEYRAAACAGNLAGSADWTVSAERSLVDDAIQSGTALRAESGELSWLEQAGVQPRAALIAPMRRGRQSEGALVAVDPLHADRFSADDELVLASFATAAAGAIATARALESRYLQRSIAASEDERRRWARELHDETLQELGALKVLQEAALQSDDPDELKRVLASASEQVAAAIEGLNGLITELRPAALDQLGPRAAIEALIEQLGSRSGVEITADFDLASEGRRHPAELEAAVYRIAQEALNNVVKHAEAARARVALVEEGESMRLTVEDDGRGFSPGDGGRHGFGLIGMRERAEQLGGELVVGEGTSGGTRVTVTLPARQPAAR